GEGSASGVHPSGGVDEVGRTPGPAVGVPDGHEVLGAPVKVGPPVEGVHVPEEGRPLPDQGQHPGVVEDGVQREPMGVRGQRAPHQILE
ncbi:hypothetical protein chiPu_0027529, partial [Chiloscyllium punctatum]|nr:hypothetical protein [Chiloscyllium punctatum]